MQLDSISDVSFKGLRLKETAEISVKEAEGFNTNFPKVQMPAPLAGRRGKVQF